MYIHIFHKADKIINLNWIKKIQQTICHPQTEKNGWSFSFFFSPITARDIFGNILVFPRNAIVSVSNEIKKPHN